MIFYNKMIKGKVRPRIGHESAEVEQRYSSTLSLTSVLGGGGEWWTPPPGRFTAGKGDLVLLVWEAGWAPGPVCTGAENLWPPGLFYILLYSVFHPYLFLCLDCSAFCLYLQHTTQTSMPPGGFEPARPLRSAVGSLNLPALSESLYRLNYRGPPVTGLGIVM